MTDQPTIKSSDIRRYYREVMTILKVCIQVSSFEIYPASDRFGSSRSRLLTRSHAFLIPIQPSINPPLIFLSGLLNYFLNLSEFEIYRVVRGSVDQHILIKLIMKSVDTRLIILLDSVDTRWIILLDSLDARWIILLDSVDTRWIILLDSVDTRWIILWDSAD